MSKEKLIQQYIYKTKNKELITSLDHLKKVKKQIHTDWGMERIFNIIPMELKTRFNRAKKTYNNDYHTSNKKVELNNMMVRAYNALIDYCINNGYNKLTKDFKFINVNNNNFLICLNEDQYNLAFNKYCDKEDIIIITLKEIINLLDNNYLQLKKDFHQFGGVIERYESKHKQ